MVEIDGINYCMVDEIAHALNITPRTLRGRLRRKAVPGAILRENGRWLIPERYITQAARIHGELDRKPYATGVMHYGETGYPHAECGVETRNYTLDRDTVTCYNCKKILKSLSA